MKPTTPNLPASLIEAVYFRPWFITPQAHASIRARVESTMAGRDVEFLGMQFEQPGMVIDGGVAIVPIKGAMGRGFTGWGKVDLILGEAVDSEVVAQELRQADANPDVRAILLDVDSPGGMLNGTPELGNVIAGLSTPTFAFTAGMMASAAYWAGAGASGSGGIYATESADIGSIGVYQLHVDWSQYLKENGIDAEMFKSGDYKGMGHPYFPLSEKQRELIQAEVLQLNQTFRDWVNKNRPQEVDPSYMEGQSVMAPEAQAAGLIDGIVSGRGDMLDYIREQIF